MLSTKTKFRNNSLTKYFSGQLVDISLNLCNFY